MRDVAVKLRPFIAAPTKLIVAGLLTVDRCVRHMHEHTADAFAFGRGFIANADLPERIRLGAAWNKLTDASMFYGDFMDKHEWPHGYVDYPTLDKAKL